jgi:hypothetical protein
MIIRPRSFPHPVLAPFTDDVMPNSFDFRLSETSDADNYYVDVVVDYENATLSSLVQEGSAIHCVHLECKRNFYRAIFSFSEHSKRLVIAASELVGRVEASAFIKAQKPIVDYRIAGAHTDYGAASFSIRPGDILAVARSLTFDAYVDYDPLKHVSSILTIQRSDDVEEGPMTLDTTGDRIVAILSQRDYDRYTELKPDPAIGPLLANQVVVPALLEAVHEIKSTSEDDLEHEMSKRWFRSVFKRLNDLGHDIRKSDVPTISAMQAVLKLPLRRSLEGLIHMDPLNE